MTLSLLTQPEFAQRILLEHTRCVLCQGDQVPCNTSALLKLGECSKVKATQTDFKSQAQTGHANTLVSDYIGSL